ncbi:MAG: lipopolysaccharide transport periplasmic protein LptA [Pseudomonadota bacterium]
MRFFWIIVVICLTTSASAQVNIGFGGEAHDANQPVEISADSLELDRASGRATFSGNVLIVQGNLRMTAGAVEVIYSAQEDSQSVSTVIATGGVLVTRGEDAAEGERAEYTVASAELLIQGNVMITQGPTSIAGDGLTVDLETGSGTITGRVRTVLESSDP